MQLTVNWTQIVYPDIAPDYVTGRAISHTEYYQDGRIKAKTDERGNRIEYRYDEARRLSEIVYPDDTPLTLADNPRNKYEYDRFGWKTGEVDPLGHKTTFVRDKLGRVIETLYGDGTSAKTTYYALGRKWKVTDQNGKVTEYRYDALGQLTGVKDPLGQWTEYGYDEAGRMVWSEDANNHRTEYEYDKNEQRTVVELPLNQQSTTSYDEVGNVKSITDFNGNTISYEYDPLNRLTLKQYSPGSSQPEAVFEYTATGQIERIVLGNRVTTFQYDSQDRLLSRTDSDGQHLVTGETIKYEYDAAGNRTKVVTPAKEVRYGYDELNRLERVIEVAPNGENLETIYSYDKAGNLTTTLFPNGVTETRTYDNLNRLELVKYSDSDSGQEIAKFDYTLDKDGYRKVVEERNGRQVAYEYDNLYRLKKEIITDPVRGNRTIEFEYDAVGNRLKQKDSLAGETSYFYDNNDRLLRQELRGSSNELVQVILYEYDNNGNTTKKRVEPVGDVPQETILTWDRENRLVGVQKPNGDIIEYTYDSEGIRVSATVNGVKTDYLVDKNLPYAQVLAEYQNNHLQAEYVYGNDLISQERDGDRSFYLVDGLGSTRGLTNENGDEVAAYSYDAFGNLLTSTESIENNYLFAGEQFDSNLGNYYFRDRYYSSETGRFTRKDVYEGDIYEPISMHKYLYANANPVNFIDPTGFIAGNMNEATNTLMLMAMIAAILAAMAAITISYIENAREKICKFKIKDDHIFFPEIKFGGVSGFHSTYLADTSAQEVYYWVDQPPENADDFPFSAIYGVPGTKFTKRSSFFPNDLSNYSVLDIISDAYVKGGCLPYGAWTGGGTDPFTGVKLPVQGYVNNHIITTAYPGGLPNDGD